MKKFKRWLLHKVWYKIEDFVRAQLREPRPALPPSMNVRKAIHHEDLRRWPNPEGGIQSTALDLWKRVAWEGERANLPWDALEITFTLRSYPRPEAIPTTARFTHYEGSAK